METTQGITVSVQIQEKAILVGVNLPGSPKKYSQELAELASLAETARVEVLARIIQNRQHLHPGSYVGKGKVEEIKGFAEQLEATLVIFDDDLSPGQARNLEKIIGLRVIDRTELILHIFASHAQTSEAKLQVELAQLEYALPRLKRLWSHLDRYEGGIGTRGPGEKQLETDKRLIQKRIRDLGHAIIDIQHRKSREVNQRSRKFATVGLIGYTNAGKSTLMNALTNADVLVEDKLFATLETRTRIWPLAKTRNVMLSDTVGFIDKLPHHLVASFKATLEEAAQSDVLLHVVDASHPDSGHQIEVVNQVLQEIGLAKKPSILVLNKVDAVADDCDLAYLQQIQSRHVLISAKQKLNFEQLVMAVLDLVEANMVDLAVALPATNGKLLAWLEQHGRVIDKTVVGEKIHYRVRLSCAGADWLIQQAGVERS